MDTPLMYTVRRLTKGICTGARVACKAGAKEVSTGKPPVVEALEISLLSMRCRELREQVCSLHEHMYRNTI
jgi:hypothetical protein